MSPVSSREKCGFVNKMRKENTHLCRSVKLATSSQLLVAGYLFREKLATSSQLLVTRKS